MPKIDKDEENERINSFFKIEAAVLALFGYDGGLCPLFDCRHLYWTIQNETDSAVLIYSDQGPLSKEMIADGDVERLEVDVSLHVNRSTYAKMNYTLVCLKAEDELGGLPGRLGIFDNEKRSEFDWLSGSEMGARQ
jgi:hypothetical protein